MEGRGDTNRRAEKILSFLHGTLDENCPLHFLRGQSDILMMIFNYACGEWWSLHISPYTKPICATRADFFESDTDTPLFNRVPRTEAVHRAWLAGCPLAVIDENVSFPPPFADGVSRVNTANFPSPFVGGVLNLNMMPFNIRNATETLPRYLHGYLPMIHACAEYLEEGNEPLTAYLTVDERPVKQGQSQRRGGLHVEGPGVLRKKEVAESSRSYTELEWYHPWGMGRVYQDRIGEKSKFQLICIFNNPHQK